MSIKIMVAVVAALSFANVGAADAAAKHKRHPVRHHGPVAYVPPAPAVAQPHRPAWAGPGECITDEGYGRYWPCGAGKSD